MSFSLLAVSGHSIPTKSVTIIAFLPQKSMGCFGEINENGQKRGKIDHSAVYCTVVCREQGPVTAKGYRDFRVISLGGGMSALYT